MEFYSKVKSILNNLKESVDNGRFYISTLQKYHNEDGEAVFDYDVDDRSSKKKYKVIRTIYDWAMNEDEVETDIYLYEPEMKGKGTHGQMINSGLTHLTTAMSQDISADIKSGLRELKRSRKMYGKSYDSSDNGDLIELGKFLDKINNKTLNAYEIKKSMKPETQKHFGDIVVGLNERSIHDPVRPGILKRQVKGKMSCSKARGIKSKQKNKGNNTAKAAQRYLNYHC